MNELETTLESLFEEVVDGICAADEHGNIEYMNPAAERLLEARLTEVRGRSLCELLCGHLATGDAKESASGCALRDHNSGVDAVTFSGEHNRRFCFLWKEPGVERVEKWKNLRVRCLRMPAPWIDQRHPNKRFVVIEDMSAR